MEEKKPSTADILAKIRAQKAAAAEAAQTAVASPSTSEPPAPIAEEVVPDVAPAPVAPKPVPAKPGSTKDIMAAIRAGGVKGAAATPPAMPTPAGIAPVSKTVATVATPAAAAGPRMSVQDMLKSMREAKSGSPAAPAPVVTKVAVTPVAALPMPAKPVSPAKGAAPTKARRGMAGLATVASISGISFVIGFATNSVFFMSIGAVVWFLLMAPFTAACASLAGIGTIWTLGTARFMFPNVLVEPPTKFKVGPESDYPINSVSNKWKDQFGIWIVHTDQYEGRNMIFALASVCTHLGCTPNWLDGEQKFKCPCHGSGFYMTGVNFEGPAPRPLERVGLRRSEDGTLEVNKSVKYQEEMGQWTDSTSFVEVV